MPNSLGAGGGLAAGFTSGFNTLDSYYYQRGLLDLYNKRQQQSEQNQKQIRYMDSYKAFMDNLTQTLDADKIQTKEMFPHLSPDKINDMVLKRHAEQIAQAKGMFATGFKHLGMDDQPAIMEAQIGTILQRPPSSETEAAMARAKEGPLKQQLIQSEIEKNRSLAGVNPDVPAPGEGLGDQRTANQRISQAFDTLNDTRGPSAEDAIRQKYDPKTIFRAEQVLGGNTTVLSGLGYRGAASQERKKIMDAAAELAIVRNIPAEQVNANVAQFMGQKRAASAAGLRVGNVTVAMDAAQAASTRVLETSSQVDRTQYPSLNSVLLAVRQQTGDPKVIQFGIAVNTLVNNYARAVGGGNAQLTDTARREAWDNLQTAWSKGQISAAVEQINKEIASELAGAQKAMKDVTSGGKKEIPPPPAGFNVLGQ